MLRINFKNILFLISGLLFILTSISFAAKEDKQYGEIKGTQTVMEGEPGPVKENICKNPKLCESLEIDLLDSLQKNKIPVMVPEPKGAAASADYLIALNLGAVVTDGLAAIINKNKAALIKIVAIMKEDGKKLGISEAVLTKYAAMITDMANKGLWTKLESTLYEFKDQMSIELADKKMQDNATLAMVSGGLEGLYILASSVDKKFSQESANLLHNKEMAKYLEKYMKTLSEDVKGKDEIKAIMAALPKIDQILGKTSYTPKDVKDLIIILEPLHKDMIKG
ncbi:MAG: hypothetical protein ACOZFS_02315 [Thermodesulfobacteriota bacterium]